MDEDIYDSDEDFPTQIQGYHEADPAKTSRQESEELSSEESEVDTSDTEEEGKIGENDNNYEVEDEDEEGSLTETRVPYVLPYTNIDLHARLNKGQYQVCDNSYIDNTLLQFSGTKHTLVVFCKGVYRQRVLLGVALW